MLHAAFFSFFEYQAATAGERCVVLFVEDLVRRGLVKVQSRNPHEKGLSRKTLQNMGV